MGYIADLISSLAALVDDPSTPEGQKMALVRDMATAQSATGVGSSGGPSANVAVTTLPVSYLADIAAIKANTAKISQFGFQLAEDSEGTVFFIKTDTVTGVSTTINVITGAPFAPVGQIELTDPITNPVTVEINEYAAITTNAGQWATSDILERIRTVNTTTGAITGTFWYNAAGTLLSTTPVIGVDVTDTDRSYGARLASVDAKTLPPGQALEALSSPVVLPATQITALTPPTNTGYSTSALQTAGNTTLTSIEAKTPSLGQSPEAASTPVVLPATQITALTPPSNAGYSTSTLQTTGNTSLDSIDTKLPPQGQATAAASTPVVLPATQITALTPPSNTGYALDTTVGSLLKPSSTLAAVTTLGSITDALPVGTNNIGQVTANAGTDLNTSLLALESGGNLASINTKIPAKGQALETGSTPVVLPATQITALTPPSNAGYSTSALQTTGNASLASINSKTRSPDKVTVAGFTSIAAPNTNIIDATGAGLATDVTAYNSADLYITSALATPSIIFTGATNLAFTEGVSNLPSIAIAQTTVGAGAFFPTVGTRRYQINLVGVNALRMQLLNAIAGVSVIAVFSSTVYSPAYNPVTVISGSTAITTLPATTVATYSTPTTDVAGAAISASATTAAFTPTYGTSQVFSVIISALTLAPALDVVVQETVDNGNTWRNCYVFPRITAIGTYNSPSIPVAGRSYRYVQTFGGTGTITRTFVRYQAHLMPQVATSTISGAAVLSTVSNFLVPYGSRVRAIYFTNNSASVVYVQIHESIGALTAASVPLIPSIRVSANSSMIMAQSDLGTSGTVFSPHTRIGVSSTFAVFTAITNAELPNMGLVIDTITI